MRNILKSLLFPVIFLLINSCRVGDFSISAPLTDKNKTAISLFDHTPFIHSSCVECHEYMRPKRMPIHGDSLNCIECHSAELDKYGKRTWLNLIKFKHSTGIISCNQCHLSRDRDSRPIPKENHPTIKYSGLDCINCHLYNEKTKNWKDAIFDHLKHLPEPISCNQCHESVRPTLHKTNPTTPGMQSTDCISCHGSKIDWKSQIKVFDHSNEKPTSCFQCHKLDAPKPIEKHPSDKELYNRLDCVLCHTFSIKIGTDKKTWKNLIFDQKNHEGNHVTCLVCHRNSNDSRPSTLTHNKYSRNQLDCNECHAFDKDLKWKKFSPFTHNKIESAETCESCHNSQNKVLKSKSSDHILTNQACNECHNVNAWKPATYTHIKEDTNCLKCHNGKTASIKPVDHTIKGPDQCSVCHDQKAWRPAWYKNEYKHANNGNLPSILYRGKLQSHPRDNECKLCHDMKTESIIYINREVGGSCYGCHVKEFLGPYHRGSIPTRMKNCIECHKYSDWTI